MTSYAITININEFYNSISNQTSHEIKSDAKYENQINLFDRINFGGFLYISWKYRVEVEK